MTGSPVSAFSCYPPITAFWLALTVTDSTGVSTKAKQKQGRSGDCRHWRVPGAWSLRLEQLGEYVLHERDAAGVVQQPSIEAVLQDGRLHAGVVPALPVP